MPSIFSCFKCTKKKPKLPSNDANTNSTNNGTHKQADTGLAKSENGKTIAKPNLNLSESESKVNKIDIQIQSPEENNKTPSTSSGDTDSTQKDEEGENGKGLDVQQQQKQKKRQRKRQNKQLKQQKQNQLLKERQIQQPPNQKTNQQINQQKPNQQKQTQNGQPNQQPQNGQSIQQPNQKPNQQKSKLQSENSIENSNKRQLLPLINEWKTLRTKRRDFSGEQILVGLKHKFKDEIKWEKAKTNTTRLALKDGSVFVAGDNISEKQLNVIGKLMETYLDDHDKGKSELDSNSLTNNNNLIDLFNECKKQGLQSFALIQALGVKCNDEKLLKVLNPNATGPKHAPLHYTKIVLLTQENREIQFTAAANQKKASQNYAANEAIAFLASCQVIQVTDI